MSGATTQGPSVSAALNVVADAVVEPTGAADFLRRFIHTRSAVLGFVLVAVAVGVALLSHWIAPNDFSRTNMAFIWEPPGKDYVLGTDALANQVERMRRHFVRRIQEAGKAITELIQRHGEET